MRQRLCAALLLVGVASSLGCRVDEVADTSPPSPSPDTSVFTFLRVTPQSAGLVIGASLELRVGVFDQRGSPLSPAEVLFVSADPALATVSRAGVVLGVAPGTTSITVVATVGGVSRSALMTTEVFAPSEAVLSADVRGWQPEAITIAVGNRVRWRSGPISWAGVANTAIHLLDENYTIQESLELKGGTVTRTFDQPGTYRYCSGGCWDPPDFGMIVVR